MAKEKILIVEDDPVIRGILTHNLQSWFSVSIAENGDQGFNKAIKEKPDLIISDVMMPVMDGIELKNKIKSNPQVHLIPFVFLTAKGREEDRLRGLMTGADDYLIKPVEPDILLKRVQMLLNRSKVYREESLEQFSNQINTVFVPEMIPEMKGFDLAWKIIPAKTGGGDLIDIIPISDDDYFIIQADVMGKGTRAKFFAYSFAGYFRGLIHAMLYFSENASPAKLLNQFSAMLDRDPFLQDTFITLFVARLSTKSNEFTYSNAGYMPGILYNHSTRQLRELSTGGGIPGFYSDEFDEESFILNIGDTLLLHSDGVNEAKNADGFMLGQDKLKAHIMRTRYYSAQDYCESIIKLVKCHISNAIQYDDISLLVLDRKK
ncbi:SpoIIE family protein phosphatase [candidate division KSB1 bacterium]|nr:SpoIIE family protein phosphatase [candidate division KSB1 bacterium]